jgi:amino acid transporter
VFWLFFLLTGLSLIVLRINDRDIERPFRVPLFPITPLIFVATSGYMFYSGTFNYAKELGLVGIGLVLLGVPFYVFSRRRGGADLGADLGTTPVVQVQPRKNF